ncbi:MAG TPA: phage tail protein, partial [Pseudolabrys sp.]
DSIYLWTWDARPYPVFPAVSDVWSDAANWETGHWLTGRLGSAPLDALIGTILADNGVTEFDTNSLGEGPDGYVVDRPMSPRGMIDPLALAFSFDASEQAGTLGFRQRGGVPVCEIDEDALVLPDDAAPAQISRAQEGDLPHEVSISFTDSGTDYQRSAVTSRRLVGGSVRKAHADLAMVTSDSEASRRAEIWLQDLWAGRESAQFALPPSMLALSLGDIVGLTVNGRRRLMEIQEISDTESRAVRACSIDPEVFALPLAAPNRRTPVAPTVLAPAHALVLDLPALQSQQPIPLARLAVFADPWPGPVAGWASTDGVSYSRIAVALAPSIMGETLDALAAGPTARWHQASFRVKLYGGALASVSDAALLAGANLAAVQHADGSWEVLQFANAELTGSRTYTLSRLLRGQGGSEYAMSAPLPAGSAFVLLDQHILTAANGFDALERELQFRVVAANRDHGDASAFSLTMTPQATALRPLAPVHLSARRGGAGVIFKWVRRARFDADSWTGEIPLGEDSEQYAVDIISGASVVRTLNAVIPSALYATADELADFGSVQPSLCVRVTQLSATVGRGFTAGAILIP